MSLSVYFLTMNYTGVGKSRLTAASTVYMKQFLLLLFIYYCIYLYYVNLPLYFSVSLCVWSFFIERWTL